MQLINIKKVTFEEVLNKYFEDHGLKKDLWEAQNLQRADTKFGHWIHTKIPIEDIGEIIMPHYKYKKITLIPSEGLTLFEVYTRFNQNNEIFKKEAMHVLKKIEFHLQNIPLKGVKSIFLSQEPLFYGTSYLELTQYARKITHLDGFHRLMALMELETKPKFVNAYISIYPNFFSEQ